MTHRENTDFILAGDIGGTKTNLALFLPRFARHHLVENESYASQDAAEFHEVLEKFLKKYPVNVKSACFGIAGPVRNGRSKTTNLPWEVSEDDLKARFGWEKVRLINDLTATALAIPVLSETELRTINPGEPDPAGTIGVVAPGTGLGIALAVRKEQELIPLASEGGHVDFAPRNEMQFDLLQHLWKQWHHVSVERIVSGPGLHTVYSWLRKKSNDPEPARLTERLAESDPPRIITEAALADGDPVCVQALDLFVSILGAVAGDVALTGLTTGGIYLGGGIPPKILPKLQSGKFMDSFTDKGRFSRLMSTIPVKVILNERAALLGAAHFFEPRIF